jgi:hypothetical protein
MTLYEQVSIRNTYVHMSWLDGLAIYSVADSEISAAIQNFGEQARRFRRKMQHSEYRNAEICWKLADELAKRIETAGGRADDDES